MRFSIIVVSLNAGEEVKKTVESVLSQTYRDFELLIKDGGSTDASLEFLPADRRIRKFVMPDSSIYDAMNQAVVRAKGEYFLFLNCGDYLMDKYVLGRVAKEAVKDPADILYGDLYRREQNSTDIAPQRITDLVCYRNVPCHQVCFYARRLFAKRAYLLEYPVRADYEHFLYSVYKEKASCRHIALTVASYMGGGFSEVNKAKAEREHRIITKQYLGAKCVFYRALMLISLQPLREYLASSPRFSKSYHDIKKLIYSFGKRRDSA